MLICAKASILRHKIPLRMDIKEIMQQINLPEIEVYVNHMHLGTMETKFHSHSKGQLLYAEGGIVHIFIKEKHWYLPARCFMWIPSNTQHKILIVSKQVTLYNFYYNDEDAENNFFKHTNIYFANDLMRAMILHTASWFGPISTQEKSKYYFLKALKENLPLVESTKLPLMIQHPFPRDPKLLEIAIFLNSNIETSYTIEDIASKFGLSTRTLSRKFKEDLGMNYVRFLRALRITKAFQLIADQQYSIYEIALMVGYSSIASFSNIFYKIAGIRPTDYQKLLNDK